MIEQSNKQKQITVYWVLGPTGPVSKPLTSQTEAEAEAERLNTEFPTDGPFTVEADPDSFVEN